MCDFLGNMGKSGGGQFVNLSCSVFVFDFVNSCSHSDWHRYIQGLKLALAFPKAIGIAGRACWHRLPTAIGIAYPQRLAPRTYSDRNRLPTTVGTAYLQRLESPDVITMSIR